MNPQLKSRILSGFAYAQVEAHESALRFGWWEKKRSNEELAGVLFRDVSKIVEISVMGDHPSVDLTDTTALEEACAQAIIRILDFSAGKKLNVASAVLKKLEYNEALSKICRKDY